MKKIIQTKIFSKNQPSLRAIRNQIDSLSIDQIAKLGLRVGFLSLGISLLVLAISWGKLPPEVPLLYSRPYGESQLMSVWGLWLLPGIGLVIDLASISWAGKVFEEDKLLAQVLIWIGGLTSLMAGISLIKIIWLVS